ncbi:YjcZ family sporulation protein [Brevibacillus ruminantium]|uniref:YjcZ family sporulation protein n=1 Tax=Brevibacillus ruminantium TaxID=2950604 RepID=A0ABY4WKH8_9BACL|nr:YjcZ family sporulation protein [Brevibacillus ruminantium]USG67184.1 YjcZ family sporulation protein [Brevibacillus ruminantium]
MSSIFNGTFEAFTLVLILFILLVIVGCSCDN